MTDETCTCPADIAAVMTAYLRGEDTTCPVHRPDPGVLIGQPPALNSDALTQSITAALGATNPGAQL